MDGLDDAAANTRCFVALGGNLGTVAETFESALNELVAGRDIQLGRISQNFATPAVGPQAGGGFLNAAAELWTSLSPRELLARLQRVEADHGRDRSIRWGPRPLDLDLILYGERVIDSPELQVPHPACWYRRFVLDPLTQIAADVVHPVKQATISDLRSRLLPRPLPVGLTGGSPNLRSRLTNHLATEFSTAAFEPAWSSGDNAPALLAWLGQADGTVFQTLPLLPRLDASATSDPLAFLREVLQASLGG
jgi:2-amino-4-hydroxy-6-hydroxymethyldihydropteridine diphosphokinase